MEHICIKVHGAITQATPELALAAQEVLSAVIPDTGAGAAYDEEVIDLDGTMLSIHFEGMYFLMEDFITALHPHITAAMNGRIDYIDMDEWTITRFRLVNGLLSHSTANLNQVMDYSGH